MVTTHSFYNYPLDAGGLVLLAGWYRGSAPGKGQWSWGLLGLDQCFRVRVRLTINQSSAHSTLNML